MTDQKDLGPTTSNPERQNPERQKDATRSQPERRSAPRFSPEPLVGVLFAHPDADTPTAGLIADVSNGGARIVAPPTARPHLHWGDPLTLLVEHSETARTAGKEGLTLAATVVRIAVDASGYTVQVRFDRSNGDWTALEAWIRELSHTAPRR